MLSVQEPNSGLVSLFLVTIEEKLVCICFSGQGHERLSPKLEHKEKKFPSEAQNVKATTSACLCFLC